MRLWVTEHDQNRANPPLESYSIEIGSEWKETKPLYQGTKNVRLHADEDCLVAFGEESGWTRLAAGVSEWFVLAPGHRGLCVRVKAEEE